jgi:hypothetical protein
VWNLLKEIMRRRRHELDRLASRVQRAHDAALERTIEQATAKPGPKGKR